MLSAIIVGAGFSGLAAGIQLLKLGITDFVILEKADRVGGTTGGAREKSTCPTLNSAHSRSLHARGRNASSAA